MDKACWKSHHKSQDTRGNVCPVHPPRPASKSMFRPFIPMLYLLHTELEMPFSQLQKHKSFMHDWKKWWRESVMTILTSLGIIACSLGH